MSAPARRGAWRPRSGPVYLGATGLFAVVTVLIAGRMAAGEDPALGLTTRPVAVAPRQAPVVREIVVTRRIRIDGLSRRQIRRRGVDRVVVVRRHVRARAAAAPVATPVAASAPSAVAAQPVAPPQRRAAAHRTPDTPAAAPLPSTPAPVVSAPAPVAAAPVVAPVVAPAPVVTATS